MKLQNRSDLYGMPEARLVSEGIHDAELVDVRRFTNAFGERMGLSFRILTGPFQGAEIMESAAISPAPRGKLALLLTGLTDSAAKVRDGRELLGRRCRIAVCHEATKTGKSYAAVSQTFR